MSKKTINPNYAVRMSNITKTFANGSIYANRDVNLDVLQGEIHAVVGENGAGKSTLMSILFGIYQPDHGEIMINNKVCHFKSAHDGSVLKIGMVHQHFKLVNAYTLLENIILGAETTKHGILDKKSAAIKIQALAKQYNLSISLDKRVYDASVGEQQRVEILKLLYRDANILIFDEPTAVLSDEEIEGFLKMLLAFKHQNKTVILVTHKLNEVKQVADRVTIIRHGMNVGTYKVKTTNASYMANMMVGRKMQNFKNTTNRTIDSDARVLLSVRNLIIANSVHKTLDKVKGISFDLKIGEILGIAGIEGNGQSELALALTGIIKPKSGTMQLFTNKTQSINIENSNVKELYRNGVAHVPEDRHKYSLILDDTVAMNVVSQQIDQQPFSKWGFINFHNINAYAKKVCFEFDVRGGADGNVVTRSLSGGNQQKLVLGRELSRAHKLLVLVQPVRGLDVGAINMIHQAIIADAQKGAAIILISYEIDEILDIANRVLIIDNGQIVYDQPRSVTTKTVIGKHLSKATQMMS